MNTHDKYALPPLLPSVKDCAGTYEDYSSAEMVEYAIAAIEADRKRRTPPIEPFAIVIDRIYDGEGPSLAYWNGENYQFSDGDCFNREGDTLDGYTAEFLTDYQLEKRLFSDRKLRGEPVLDRADLAFILDELREAGLYRAANLVADAMRAPQPAESVQVQSMRELIADDAYAATFQSVGQYRKALLARYTTTKEQP